MRRTVMVVVALAALGLAGPVPSVGAAAVEVPVTLTTNPVLVVPGTNATVTGPAVTCPNGSEDSLVVEVPEVTAAMAAVQGEPLAVDLAVPVGTASEVYPVVASCLAYSGGSIAVGSGWMTVTDANGLPPASATANISVGTVTEGQTVEVWSDGDWFAPDSDVQVWMYSDPVLLGNFTASATGSMVGQVTMPTGSAIGSHTVVVAGTDVAGRPTFLTVGITVGKATGAQVTVTPAANTAATAAATATTAGAAAATAAAAPLPVTGGGIGLALPAAGLVGLGSVFAALARWFERLDRRPA